MKFNNILEATSWLEHQPRFKEKVDLYSLKEIFEDLEINLTDIKKIHVAGTNGKGSTSAYLTNVLVNNKYKVGTFTSPYLVKFNERIRLNNIPIEDKILLDYINYFYEYNNKNINKLSFFEIITMISFKYFSESKCDFIIIEVGIGGRLDATNILNYDLSIITSVGYDHTDKLGNTLEKIAYEKVMILKENGILVTINDLDVMEVFEKRVKNTNSKYIIVSTSEIINTSVNSFKYKNKHFEIGLFGDYQKNNALLAYTALKQLTDLKDDQILPFLKTTKWEGRFEEIAKDVYLDGAHNISAINSLMENISKYINNKKITILYSALKDKEIAKMLDIIKKFDYKIVLTSFPDFRFASLSDFQTNKIQYIENGYETLKMLINEKKKDEIIIATGSLHFIGYLKQNFLKDIQF